MEAKINEAGGKVGHRGASSTIRTTFGEQVGNFIPVNEGVTWHPVNGNSGQGAQSKRGGFEGGDGIKIRLGRPTTGASVNGIEVVDKEKDRGPGLGWKELKQIHTVVCGVRERGQLSSVVAGGTKEYRTAKKELVRYQVSRA